ncbi:hypothetical protein [Swaminathania salitolerans]|nr:hypothetical protein [Swaminathania salitolerans]
MGRSARIWAEYDLLFWDVPVRTARKTALSGSSGGRILALPIWIEKESI